MKKERRKRIAAMLAGLLLAIPPLLPAQAEEAQIMPRDGVERRARAGELLELDLPASSPYAVQVEGVVYGCEIKRYQTWFETAKESLWEAVGAERPQGVLAWEDFAALADAVRTYNAQGGEPLLLLAVQPQRFPANFALMDDPDVRAQWEAMQDVVGPAEEGTDALLTERVLALDEIRSANYVAAITRGGAVVPLSGPEARCMAIERDTADVAAAQAEITAWAESATPAATGLLPPDMTYEQFCEEWQRSYPAALSQANFELWMQML
ncbi:MAG TPA: hypothetical protein IAC49_08700 [Candidatus Ventricola intestinavium]|nr:hypothetical protein [Candidatus Ventricola intestinavium]